MKTEKMIWGGVGKYSYTAPEMNVYELSADAVIMQMSSAGATMPGFENDDTVITF